MRVMFSLMTRSRPLTRASTNPCRVPLIQCITQKDHSKPVNC